MNNDFRKELLTGCRRRVAREDYLFRGNRLWPVAAAVARGDDGIVAVF